MPAIPAQVIVGPHTFTIDSTPETARLLRDENSRGDSRSDQLLIRIDTDRPHTSIADTLLHEVLHAVWQQTSLRCEHGDDAEEKIVLGLATPLLGVLRANPDLVRYLTA